jgi:hypothetical protein
MASAPELVKKAFFAEAPGNVLSRRSARIGMLS